MLKKPISYFIIFALMHSSLAQVAYGMFPEQEYKHVPFVQSKALQEQKQGDPNKETPVPSSKPISSSPNLVLDGSIYTPSSSLVDLNFVKETAQPELPTSQPQAIAKQSNAVPANNPNSPQLQSQSGSPTHIPGDSTPEKSCSSSTTSSPEKSPREVEGAKGGGNTFHENRSNVTTVLSSDLNVSVQQQLTQLQVQEESITNQNLGTNTNQDEEGDVFHDALDHDDSITIDIKGQGVAQTSKIVHPPSSQPKPSEKTPLISKKKHQDDETQSLLISSEGVPSSPPKQSLISQAWNFATGFFKKKKPEKELPSNSVIDSSSPLLPSDDEDSDSSDAVDGSVEDKNKDTSSGEEEKTLGQNNPSINKSPNQGFSKELDLYNPDEKSWVIVDLYKNMEADKKGKTTPPQQKETDKPSHPNGKSTPPLDDKNKDSDPSPEKNGGITVVDIDDSTLSPAVRAFLLHVKDRVIDGKLNGKQIAGIVGGVATGAAVAMPLIAIFNDGVFELNNMLNGQLHGETPLTKSIIGIMGPTLGLDATSRTTTILVHYGESDTDSFSIKKNKIHRCALFLTRSGIYTGALIASFLPLYYWYSYVYLCEGKKCKEVEESPQSYDEMFAGFGPILVLDTTLQYGYQLSQEAERAINKRFNRIRNLFSPIEQKRQSYLDYLKHLKRIIYHSNVDTLHDLYEDIFVNKGETVSTGKEIDPTDLKVRETLRVSHIFQTFYHQATKIDEPEAEELTKQASSSRWGWVAAVGSTVGRTVVFSKLMETMFHAAGVHGPWNQVLTVIFGGLVGNLIQGKIEKDAAKQVVYGLAGGKKIPNGSSHRPLRIGIKTWDYIYGIFNTLPYILVGIDSTRTWDLGWRIATLVPFGMADAFNNATAFDESNFAVVNAVDSTFSYCCPFEGYKKDKLVRMTRQLRRLFKTLQPNVLETIDQKLTLDGV